MIDEIQIIWLRYLNSTLIKLWKNKTINRVEVLYNSESCWSPNVDSYQLRAQIGEPSLSRNITKT